MLVLIGLAARLPDLWSLGIVLAAVGVMVALVSRVLGVKPTEMHRHYF